MMFSPSSVTMRRSTPCVLGCCGPIFSISSSVRRAMAASPLPRAHGGRGLLPEDRFPLDLFLQFEDSLDQGLGAGRAACNVDVHRNDLIDPLEDGVVVIVERSTTRGARSHGNDIAGLGHLLPQSADDGGDLDR